MNYGFVKYFSFSSNIKGFGKNKVCIGKSPVCHKKGYCDNGGQHVDIPNKSERNGYGYNNENREDWNLIFTKLHFVKNYIISSQQFTCLARNQVPRRLVVSAITFKILGAVLSPPKAALKDDT